ncbi:DsbA family protein [Candidatus Poriferisocius sp.]|uniref:mycothiol-dependent nitroreductase Rv2466c family protein n=1 Tax=Candidatus Poriferisocius sp. TaxID=3101276 RepID=UPI003B013559
MPDADIEFFWDPICPFAWLTSRWVTDVARQRDYEVDWRLICLSILNEDSDYENFPEGYQELHHKGRRMLRVAQAVRDQHGAAAAGELYTAYGTTIWNPDADIRSEMGEVASDQHLKAALERAGLSGELADRAEDESLDDALRESTMEALSRTGRDVGTPIITFHHNGGATSFFGPVVSQIPPEEEAVRLWDAVVTLAEWPSFAELKRSKRDDLVFPKV